MVKKIVFILLWQLSKFIVGLIVVSSVVAVEFFIGFDIIAIEGWIIRHPYELLFFSVLLSLGVEKYFLHQFFTDLDSIESKITEIQKRLWGFSLFIVIWFGLWMISQFSTKLLVLSILKSQSNLFSFLSLNLLVFIEVYLLKKLIDDNCRLPAFFIYSIVIASLTISINFLLIPDFKNIYLSYGVIFLFLAHIVRLLELSYKNIYHLILMILLTSVSLLFHRSIDFLSLTCLYFSILCVAKYLLRSLTKC